MTAPPEVTFRPLEPADFWPVVGVADDWWGGRPVRGILQRLFFDHFGDTSLIAEASGQLAGFLIGFLSSSRPGEAYIHAVAVSPVHRGLGLGRELYGRFFAIARARGAVTVHSITAPVNRGSIAFHRSMGFDLAPSDRTEDGFPVHSGHDPGGGYRVLFVRQLTAS